MKEESRRRESFGSGPQGLGTVFDESPAAGLVRVTNGPYDQFLPVGGMTVAEIRARFRDRFDIDPQSQGFVDGHAVSDDTVVDTSQILSFVRKAGEKG